MGNIFRFGRRPATVTETFGDTQVRFYQVSPQALLRLRGVAKPLVKALSIFLDAFLTKEKTPSSRGYSTRETRANDGTVMVMTEVPAVDIEYQTLRDEKRTAALQELLEACLDGSNLREIYRLIADSMRDVFHGRLSDEQVDEAFADIGTEDFIRALIALGKANTSMFAPFLSSLREAAKEAIAKLAAAKDLQKAQPGDPSSSPTSSGTPSPTISS